MRWVAPKAIRRLAESGVYDATGILPAHNRLINSQSVWVRWVVTNFPLSADNDLEFGEIIMVASMMDNITSNKWVDLDFSQMGKNCDFLEVIKIKLAQLKSVAVDRFLSWFVPINIGWFQGVIQAATAVEHGTSVVSKLWWCAARENFDPHLVRSSWAESWMKRVFMQLSSYCTLNQ